MQERLFKNHKLLWFQPFRLIYAVKASKIYLILVIHKALSSF